VSDEPPKDSLGGRIRAKRAELGLGQSALADAVGIRPHVMYRYELQGMTPRAPVLAKIAGVLGVSVEWLLAGRDNASSRASRVVYDEDKGGAAARVRRAVDAFLATAEGKDYERFRQRLYSAYRYAASPATIRSTVHDFLLEEKHGPAEEIEPTTKKRSVTKRPRR
jgi:transcriptional regulator with XRE-family HTH domain